MSSSPTWTIPAVRAALDARKISARELVKDFYERIERRNTELNIFLALSPERAYAQADKIDSAIAAGDALPSLAGVPLAVKDGISTHGIPTTCGSRILKGYKPPYDASAQRLRAWSRSGAIISSAKRIATNSRWEVRMKTPRTARSVILLLPIMSREARAADRLRQWLQAWQLCRSERTQAVRFGSRDRFAASLR